MEKTKLTPIRFPVDLLDDLDKYIGDGQKSKFIIEATRKELTKIKQQKALLNTAGLLKEEEYPEFSSSDSVYKWVRELRALADAQRSEYLVSED
ncbi:MAG: hypothetical protein ACOY35_12825 [Bacillota bacterium]|nr:hypothetical protein [Bacillota bacterium]